MGSTMKDLGIDRLSAEERAALAMEIWDSLGESRPSAKLSAEQQAELTRRDADLDADQDIALTWSQIRASVEAGQ